MNFRYVGHDRSYLESIIERSQEFLTDSTSRPTQLSSRISSLINSNIYPSRSDICDIDKVDKGSQCSNNPISDRRKTFRDRGLHSNPMSSSDLCT